jgi:hypothetical protein
MTTSTAALYRGEIGIYRGVEIKRSVTRPGVMKMIDSARWIYRNPRFVEGLIDKAEVEPWIALGRFVETGVV